MMSKKLGCWAVLAIVILNMSAVLGAEPPQLAYLHLFSDDPTQCDKVLIGNVFGDIKQQFELPPISGCMPPIWSPDGNYLVVWSPSIVLINLQTQTTQVLSDDKGDWWVDSPVWSHDGAYLAWRESKGSVDKKQHWILMHIQDGKLETLNDLSDAKISPDKIRFVQYRDEAFFLVQSGQAASKLTLPESAKTCQPLDLEQCYTDNEIIQFDSDGGNRIFRFTHRPDILEGSPQWSSNNKQIVYQTLNVNTGITWIEMMASDGSDLRQITPPSKQTWDIQPQWSPDGEYISFSRDVGLESGFKIYVIKPDGSDLQYIGDGLYPTWRPISKS